MKAPEDGLMDILVINQEEVSELVVRSGLEGPREIGGVPQDGRKSVRLQDDGRGHFPKAYIHNFTVH